MKVIPDLTIPHSTHSPAEVVEPIRLRDIGALNSDYLLHHPSIRENAGRGGPGSRRIGLYSI